MMFIPKALTFSLLLGVLALGGCGARVDTGQTGQSSSRNSANVVTQAQIERLPSVSTVEEVLVLLVAGIDEAGSGIQIRGMQGSPLIVVNGVPAGNGPIPVAPRDVERIQVLRTGGEIAAYGFRGNGGVILVETRGR
jgi:outer membrane receptor for ferrienterochelin and colicin